METLTLIDLERELAAMPDPLDLPRTLSQREVNAHTNKRTRLAYAVSVGRAAASMLAETELQIATLTAQRDDLAAIRAELCDDLLAIPSGTRDRAEQERLRALRISILALDGRFDLQGEMYPSPLPLFDKLRTRCYVVGAVGSEWNLLTALYGSVPTIERRLTELTKQQAAAQRMLDSLLTREPVPI